MITLKKILALTTGLITICTLGACGNTEDKTINADIKYKIGIAQLVDHDSLDAARNGFIDGLKELGYEDGVNISIDYQNAQGAPANNQTIATQFVNDKKDLILAIATPTAQAMSNATKDIPILVTAVTDPEASKLVETNEKPNKNVSGTSDMAPIKEQIELIKEIMPEIKTLGLLYSSSEDNSIIQIEIAKKICDELNIDYIEATVANVNDITQVVTNLANKVEAVYSPTDNVIASAMPNVRKICNEQKIPTYTGWSADGDKGGMAAYAISYYELGKITAKQAVDILVNDKSPAVMPIEYQTECEVIIDWDNAKELNITIPEKYKEKN